MADLKFGHYTGVPRCSDFADMGRSMLRPYAEHRDNVFSAAIVLGEFELFGLVPQGFHLGAGDFG
jgi:hypothetical protein